MNQRSDHHYEFGAFRLDVAERLLLRDGETIPLQPKAFDLLRLLVEHPGHLLEKDELLKAIWPDTVVEEVNLANNISVLRKALGDGENGQKYIETVPRRGYRFVAGVREIVEESEESKTSAQATPVNKWPEPSVVEPGAARLGVRRSFLTSWRLLAVALGVALIAVAVISFTRRSEDRGVQIKSLAVLPFKPLATNSRDEALELGMADTLITKLSNLRQIIVRPTSAVRKYAALDQDPLAAGREQRVDAVLESSMNLLGEKIRVTVRLLDVSDGRALWTYQCTEYCTDIFAAQDAISQKVAEALALELNGEDRRLLAKHYTNSAEAWQLYVRGRYLSQQRGIANVEKAIAYFERAIALDPDFALAHAELGFCYASLTYWKNPPKELMPKAKAANDRALMLDGQLAEAHAYLALYKRAYEWDYAGAEREHRLAIDLNPNSAEAHRLYAFYLTYMRRFEEGISEIKRAEMLDPTSPFVSDGISQILYFARRYDEAIVEGRRAIDLHPDSETVYHWLSRAYEMKGNEQGAFAAYLGRAEVDGAGPDDLAGMKAAFAAGGLRGYWRRQLDRLLEREKREFVLQIDVALLYARLGQKEQALARLQRAVEDRNHHVIALKVEPLWDSYRADPRFMALVKRVGLAP
jgi:DNA-binding winged helix-turn-helix (wHTH) protein/TolB-like protein